MKCEYCRYWLALAPSEAETLGEDFQESGFCRVKAPGEYSICSRPEKTLWPIIEKYDWCGEFKEKEGAS
jgi:hypothetical protein